MITAYFVAVANEFSSRLHLNSGYSSTLEIGSEEGFNNFKIDRDYFSLWKSVSKSAVSTRTGVLHVNFFAKLLQNDSYSMSDLMTILLS